ncbi:MAG: GNAT family N-acetyltransferase [Oscillospiraceae bacterium]|nr:GNAT family N-acetyltransferase [Oscillospiraceae bacterium]
MIIREITPEDIEIITQMRMQMLDEVTDDPLPAGLENQIRRFVWKHMRDRSCLGVVAEKDGKVIADAVIYLFETMPDEVNISGLTAMLYNVYTLPEYRGGGIMAKMLPEVIRLAREAGAVELKMTAEKKAIPLYERMGFHVNDDAMKMVL